MIQSDKEALHAKVIANTAHKIEKVAQELSSLYKDSFINNERIELRQKHLVKYLNELNNLVTNKFYSQALLDRDKAFMTDHKVYEDSYVQ